jgi:hypothetical protein
MATSVKTVPKEVSALLFSKNPKVIDSIQERQPSRFNPRGNRTGLNPGDTIEFEFTSDQFVDVSSALLCFDLNIAATDSICNAADVIERISIYYNDVLLEQISDANAWSNALLAYSAHRNWCQSEGKMILGLTNQVNSNAPSTAAGTVNGARAYAVPLGLVSGLFRMKNYLPLLGNKLRVSILLAPAKDVINYTTAAVPATQTYSLNKISILMDTIVCTQGYASTIRAAMNTSEGLRLPFTSLQMNSLTVGSGTNQYLRIPNNLSNAMSLFMLYDNSTTKVLTQNLWNFKKQSFPLPTFSSLRVRCGTKMFTPPDDLRSFAELYTSAEKCVNSVCDITGTGYIDFKTFTGGYAAHTDLSNAAAVYGLALIGVNLEKTIEPDDNVINNGLAAIEAGNSDFDVQLTTTSGLAVTDNILSAISHKRALVFASHGITCEY